LFSHNIFSKWVFKILRRDQIGATCGSQNILIKASNNPKAEGRRESVDAQSGLPKSIAVCKGAKFRLTSNIWTAMGLTNGAKGVVHSIIYAEGSKPPELPVAVIGTFEHYTGHGPLKLRTKHGGDNSRSL
jgi:hypothetical protein